MIMNPIPSANIAGIVFEAYSPLCNPGRPVHLREVSDPVLLEDPLVQEIASKHGVTAAQVKN